MRIGLPVIAALCALSVACTTQTTMPPPSGSAISSSRLGPVVLGMTLADVRSALSPGEHLVAPAPTAVMTYDREWKLTDRAGRVLATIFIESGTVESATARDARFSTAEGVRPGMTISEAAGIYGPATLSQEIEGTGLERVQFSRQPRYLTFTTSGSAGIYGTTSRGSERFTTLHPPDATISGVTIGW